MKRIKIFFRFLFRASVLVFASLTEYLHASCCVIPLTSLYIRSFIISTSKISLSRIHSSLLL